MIFDNTDCSLFLTSSARQVHTFYEAVGYMISAQPNKPQQEKLIAKLMELPNNAVRLTNSCFTVQRLTLCTVGFFDGTSSTEHGRAE